MEERYPPAGVGAPVLSHHTQRGLRIVGSFNLKPGEMAKPGDTNTAEAAYAREGSVEEADISLIIAPFPIEHTML